ncbi:MAG: Eco57I restriction-modification methylase domain-containing protein [Candidatus Hodarchaeales archaeon]|jgi:cell division protein FtsB
MTSQTRLKTKLLGQYYTPEYIVHYIIDQTIGHILKNNSYERATSLKILDPACGLGIFLVQALDFLLSHLNLEEKVNESLEIVTRKIIANQLYGIDIDNTQIVETQKNLNCLDFNLNFKVFNALLPPTTYDHQCDTNSLGKLRNRCKELYIKGNETFYVKEGQRKISQIEKHIQKTLAAKLKKDFKLSSNIHPFPWEVVYPETEGKFDAIIGNPPWGANLFSSDLLIFYNVGTQQVDSWSLFIERSLIALKEGGRLGFVIPNTFLMNENYTDIRKFILDSCRIVKIINLGENVFPQITQPCMIVIAEKRSHIPDSELDVIRYVSPKIKKLLEEGHRSISSLPTINCSQNRFLSNSDYQFNIFSIGYEELRATIEKDLHHDKIQVKPLRYFVKNARGVELNKNGKIVQCSSCGWWSSPPSQVRSGTKTKLCINPECHKEVTEHNKTDFIVSDIPKDPEKDQPFLVGYQIQRYYIKNHKFIDSTRIGINYKDPALYHGPKLLLRKTGHGIKTAIDYNNRWVNQVVYLFKLKNNVSITLEYIMGVVNSKLLNKYFFIEFADPYRQDFPHFTQKRFLRLPIKTPVTDNETALADQIGKKAKILQSQYQRKYSLIQQFQEKNAKIEQLNQKIQQLEKEIDHLVCEIYSLTPNQEREIFSDFFL